MNIIIKLIQSVVVIFVFGYIISKDASIKVHMPLDWLFTMLLFVGMLALLFKIWQSTPPDKKDDETF